jgi:hypothetical protein
VSEESEWQFDQPPNCAVISVREIVFGDKPILFVSRDEGDHGWQFLAGDTVSKEEAVVVGLGEVVKLDPSVLKLFDLPPGWVATRPSANASWERGPRS